MNMQRDKVTGFSLELALAKLSEMHRLSYAD